MKHKLKYTLVVAILVATLLVVFRAWRGAGLELLPINLPFC